MGALAGEVAEAARLAALHATGLLDSETEPAFDRLTRLVTTVLGVPVSLVSLIDRDRQVFKSQRGLTGPWATARETPLSHSFCQHVAASGSPFIVEDSLNDDRVRGNLAITDLGVAAYAGFPISTNGTVIGSLCAIDTSPRVWTPKELGILRELAALVETELDLRAALGAAAASVQRAEQAIAERTAVIESTGDGIYAVDLAGACTLANAAAAASLCFSPDELLGKDMHSLVHHHHADGTVFPSGECPLYRAFSAGEIVANHQTTLWRRDGTPFPAECAAAPLFVDGTLTGAVITFRDVTERERIAAALRESEMKFRAVFEEAGIGIAITSMDGRLLDVNAAYERLTGYPRDVLLDMNFAAVTHPEDANEEVRRTRAMLDGESPQLRMDKRYLRSDGRLVWGRLTATVMRDASGSPRYIVGAVEDVTERRRASDAMALLVDAGALLGSSLEYSEVVPAALRLVLPLLGDAAVLQLPRPDGTIEAICVDLRPDREVALCELSRAHDPTAGAGAIPQLEQVDLFEALRVVVPARSGAIEGRLTFLAERPNATADDRQLAEELARQIAAAVGNAQSYGEARAATRARDEVLAVVSHDLRNPIHTISMAAALLIDLPDLDPAARRTQIDIVRRSARRANRLINDLLEVTRIENGQLRVDRRPVAVSELLTEAIQIASGAAGERGITLCATPPLDAVHTFADRDRIVQALDNLLGNAIKFTPRGGNIEVRAEARGDDCRFEVIDTGMGIPPAVQSNLFTRFWQAGRDDRRGVGLGLSIVKGIVDAHGGTIEVASDGTSGTTMAFTIPGRAADRDDASGPSPDGGRA